MGQPPPHNSIVGSPQRFSMEKSGDASKVFGATTSQAQQQQHEQQVHKFANHCWQKVKALKDEATISHVLYLDTPDGIEEARRHAYGSPGKRGARVVACVGGLSSSHGGRGSHHHRQRFIVPTQVTSSLGPSPWTRFADDAQEGGFQAASTRAAPACD